MNLNERHPTLHNLALGSGLVYLFFAFITPVRLQGPAGFMLMTAFILLALPIFVICRKFDGDFFRILFVISTFIAATLFFVIFSTILLGILPVTDLGFVILLALFTLVQYSIATEPPLNPVNWVEIGEGDE